MRECKEVLKGGLLMKQYYQFMLRGVVTDAQGLQTNANIDEFEEDLHKMLVVRPPKFPSPLRMSPIHWSHKTAAHATQLKCLNKPSPNHWVAINGMQMAGKFVCLWRCPESRMKSKGKPLNKQSLRR